MPNRLQALLARPERRRGARIAAVLAIGVGALFLFAHLGRGLDQDLQAWRDRLHRREASGKIVLVEIDARSLASIDRWPWPRGRYADAVNALKASGASLAAFDIDFSARSDPAEDTRFAEAIAQSGMTVVLPTFRQAASDGAAQELENLPTASLRAVSMLGSVSIRPDADGSVRTMPYGIDTAGNPRPSYAVLLAGGGGASGDQFPIDGSIDPASIPRVSFIDLVSGRAPPGALRGKAVLVGATAVEMGDHYVTPSHGLVPGAVLQVLAAETLIQSTIPIDHGGVIPLAGAILGVLGALRLRGAAKTVALIVATAATLAAPLALELMKLGTLQIAPALAALASALIAFNVADALGAVQGALTRDVHTGMPNERALAHAAARAKPSEAIATAMIGGFDALLAAIGREGMNELLRRLAERIDLSGRGPIFQPGRDRLAWLESALDENQLDEFMDGLSTLLRAPVQLAGRSVATPVAIGLSSPEGAPAERIARSSLAAQRSLSLGARWVPYSQALEAEASWRLQITSEIDAALANGDLWVAYQPKYSLAAEAIVSVEALARWKHKSGKTLAPDLFIPILEEADRIFDLTLHVLDRALSDQAAWRAQGLDLSVAVNISAILPANPAFQAAVKRTLARHAPPKGKVVFEVTESAALADPEASVAALEVLAAMGVDISIDDYGAGLSTLTYLKRLPAQEIKIDKGLVLGVENSPPEQAMVRSTILLAHELGMRVVAEGVETRAAFDILAAFGCDLVQGWYIERPTTAEALPEVVKARQAMLRKKAA